MTTANATTDGSGYMIIGGAYFGNAIPRDEMYSDKVGSIIKWKYKFSEHLTILKYDEDKLVAIGAMRLSDAYPDSTLIMCHVYHSLHTRHVALHCPILKRLVIIKIGGGYVIRKDESFTGKTYK
jgi:hypothetical protein